MCFQHGSRAREQNVLRFVCLGYVCIMEQLCYRAVLPFTKPLFQIPGPLKKTVSKLGLNF